MYIENIKIGNFGKLSCKEIELTSGVNVLEGRNEAGKTTISEFIKFVFYGLSNKTTDGEMSERKRYISWNTNDASGSIVLNTEKGRFRIERSMVPHGAGYKDNITVVDLSNNSVVENIKNPGEYFFGIPEDVFTRTVYIRQADGAYFNGETIGQAVENIFYSADESVNTDKALKKIDDARVMIKHKKNTGRGLIDQLDKEEEELTQRLVEARGVNEQILQTENSLRIAVQSIEKNKNECEKMTKQLRLAEILRLLEKFDEKKKYETNIEKTEFIKKEIIKETTRQGFFPDESYKQKLENAKNELVYLKKDVDKYSEEDSFTTSPAYSKELAEKIREYGSRLEIKDYLSKLKSKKKNMLTISLTMILGALVCGILGILLLPILFVGSALLGAVGIVCFVQFIASSSGVKKVLNDFSARNEKELFDIVSKTEEYEKDERRNNELMLYKEQNKLQAQKKMEEQIGFIGAALSEWGVSTQDRNYSSVLECIDNTLSSIAEIYENIEKCDKDLGKNQAVLDMLELQLEKYDEKSLRDECSTIDVSVDLEKTDEIKKYLDFSLRAKESLLDKVTELERTLATLKAKTDKPSDIESRLKIVKERTHELNMKHSAYVMAYEKLQEAGTSLRSKLAPGLSLSAGKFMGSLTSGKYKDIGVSDKLRMTYSFEENGSDYTKEIESLSSGTKDIAYISLRLALAELFCKTGERLPVIFDEAFARVDDVRLRNMLVIASEYANNNSQSIVFTSHSRESMMIKEIGEQTDFKCLEV